MKRHAALAFIKPCLAETAGTPPSGDDWVHEIKYDGYRVQAHLERSHARLFTRNALDWTGKFGAVVADLQALKVASAIIDCEAIVQKPTGVSDFHALQHELTKGSDAQIALMAFDLMHLNGKDVRPQPLLARKSLLRDLLGDRQQEALLRYSDHTPGDGPEVLASACRLGLEGIISKRAGRPYRSGRSTDWLKSKCVLADPFVVIGFTRSEAQGRHLASLVLGYHVGGRLTYAGRVGTGFSANDSEAIWQGLQAIKRERSPVAKPMTGEQRAGVTWVNPVLVAQVEYRGWTPDGVLRQAAFKAFRQDKQPIEIGRPPSLGANAGDHTR